MDHDRISRLKEAIQTSSPGVCTERALIWIRYFKKRENRKKHPAIQMAEALCDVLRRKSINWTPAIISLMRAAASLTWRRTMKNW